MLLPLRKNIKSSFPRRTLTVATLAFMTVVVLSWVLVFSVFSTNVTIDYNGTHINLKTMKGTVGDVLMQGGVSVSEFDYVSLPLDTKLPRNKMITIHIKTAVPINVFVDGKENIILTSKETIAEALQASSLGLSDYDRIEGAERDDKICEGMEFSVVRVRREVLTENEVIPYEVDRRANDSMVQGEQEVINKGKTGMCEKTYVVVYEDNKEIDRQLIDDTVISQPEIETIEYGTIPTYTASRGDVLRYTQVLDMSATAYTASYRDTNKHPDHPQFGITYTGVRVKKGIVAVDPTVIPLGTRLYIEGLGDTPDYGYAVAADIGSAIKGYKIDLYMDGQDVVDAFGRKDVRVYILY